MIKLLLFFILLVVINLPFYSIQCVLTADGIINQINESKINRNY